MRALAFVTAALILGGLLVTASPAEAPVSASASASVLDGTVRARGDVASRDGSTPRLYEQANIEEPGVAIVHGESSARSALRGGDPVARATAVARSVRLLDGVVTAYGIRRTVDATRAGIERDGRVDGLFIGGRSYGDLTERTTIDLPDHSGRVILNHGTAGLRIKLDRAGYGLPAGTDIRVAVVRASARVGRATTPEEEPGEPAATPTPAATPSSGDRRGAAKARRARDARRRLTGRGFAFPVFGDAQVADDWGAARQIGAHQGNDIFAPFGAPVLAVADGVVSKVGTLPISGNRLWLTTGDGDAFFYAHLSAFSPNAVNGRRVKAGTVLGFTGNTGDAEPTPPHVHFQIHPGGGDAIDPHEILLAWQGRRDVALGDWLQRYGGDTAARPGALVEVRDFIAGE